MTTPASSWTCPTCTHTLETVFCPSCGEQALCTKDLTFRSVLKQLAVMLTNIDGLVLRSFKKLLLEPGALTVSYQQGQRKPYMMPVRLFLFANLLFFAMQTVAEVKIFATPLDMHLHDQFWKDLAQTLVTERLAHIHMTLNAYTPLFNQAVALNAKMLIALMILPLAAVLPLLFWHSRKPFAVHAMFSVPFFSFLMMLWTVVLAGLTLSTWLGGPGLESVAVDHTISLLETLVCLVYLTFATRAVYGARGVTGVLKSALLVAATTGIFLGYRFLLFVITLYTTSGAS